MASASRPINRRLRFAQLELMHEVVESGNLADAARRLHMTRAGVSKAIKELERGLGQELFHRSRSGMAPTAAGLRVAKHARLLINELHHLKDEATSASRDGAGVLRLGMSPFVGEHFAPEVLLRLRRQSGGAVRTVEVQEGRLNALIERLLRGEVDAVLSLYAPRAVDGLDLTMLSIRPFSAVPMVVVASPELGLPDKQHRWQDLLAYPWILAPASTHQRRSFDEMFTAHGHRAPAPAVESGSLSANVRLAAAGLGLALVPLQAAEPDIASGQLRVVKVRPALPPTVVALLHRKVSMIYMDALRALESAIDEMSRSNPSLKPPART